MSESRRQTKRRGNGEGSIFQRADGRWVAKLATGYSGDGKRIRRVVYGKTKKEVQDKLSKLQQRKSVGALSNPSSATVSQFIERWLEDDARLTTRNTTHRRYKQLMDVHVKPHIGGVQLQRLVASDVQSIFSAMERDGLSPRTRQFVFDIINMALKCAVRQGLTPFNVCSQLTRPKAPKQEMHCLSQVQASAMLKAAETDRLSAMYVLALSTGMRKGELFALRWQDIDLKGKRLSVKHTLTDKGELTAPKSKRSQRSIALPQMAVDALWEHKTRMLAEVGAGCDLVFCDTNGGYLRQQNVLRRSFRPVMERTKEAIRKVSAEASEGFPPIRFHDLRHTYATLAMIAGVHVKVVSETLGHASVGFTLDTYSHVLPNMQTEAATAMDKLFSANG